MKQKTLLVVLLLSLIILPLTSFAAPRAYFKTGTASSTNATVTFTFNPASFCVANDETAGGTALWFDITDGIAVAADNSTNIKVLAGETVCASLLDKNVTNAFTVGVITASSTASYRIFGIR